LRPIIGDAGKLECVLLPPEMRKRGVSLFEKLRESGVRRQKRQRAQSFCRRLTFVVRARRTEFAEQSEVVQQYLLVTFLQHFFENCSFDFGDSKRRVGNRIKKT